MLQFSYFLSPALVRHYGNRKVVATTFSVLHRLAWVPLMLLLYVDWTPPVKHALLVLTLLCANACAVVAQNAWFSWMTDLIPPTIRGSYYGRRNAFLGLTSLITLFLGSQVLSFFREQGLGPAGYTICFSTAVASALFAARMLWRQFEPRTASVPKISLQDVYRLTKAKPLMWDYIRFAALWQFSLGLGAAFFGIHMVKVLKMTPAEMGYQGLVASVTALIGSRIWGKARDRVGDRAIVVTSGLLIGAHVWIWMPSREGFLLPVWIVSVVGGFFWAGFNISSFSWPQKLCGKADRQYTFGFLGLLSGPGFVLGSIMGGALTTYLPEVLFHIGSFEVLHYHLVFSLSSLGRILAILLLAHWSLAYDRNTRTIRKCFTDSFGAMCASPR
jgi:MFS-type transporter involved in bile tolerance (Atg22 family)